MLPRRNPKSMLSWLKDFGRKKRKKTIVGIRWPAKSWGLSWCSMMSLRRYFFNVVSRDMWWYTTTKISVDFSGFHRKWMGGCPVKVHNLDGKLGFTGQTFCTSRCLEAMWAHGTPTKHLWIYVVHDCFHAGFGCSLRVKTRRWKRSKTETNKIGIKVTHVANNGGSPFIYIHLPTMNLCSYSHGLQTYQGG